MVSLPVLALVSTVTFLVGVITTQVVTSAWNKR